MFASQPSPRSASSSYPSSSTCQRFQVLTRLKSADLLMHLRENQCPTPTRAHELAQILSHAQLELNLYDSEIIRLHGLILSLQNDLQDLKTHMRMAKSLLVPMRKLPPEILVEIFLHHGKLNRVMRTANLASNFTADFPAMKLSSVCHHWRMVALATQSLWSNITLDVYSAPLRLIQAAVEALLERSGQSGLIIRFEGQPDQIWRDGEAVMALLRKNCYRWERLTCTEPMLAYLVNKFPVTFPILKTLQILPVTSSGEVIDMSRVAPALHAIHFRGLYDGHSKLKQLTYKVSIPWNRITFLNLKDTTAEEAIDVLSRCSNLFTALFSGLVVRDELHGREFTTSSIRSLTIAVDDRDSDFQVLKSFFTRLTLPLLSSITLRCDKRVILDPDWPIEMFLSFISRSGCAITMLHLEHIYLTPKIFAQILISIPSLVHLSVIDLAAGGDKLLTQSPLITDKLLTLMHVYSGSLSVTSPPILPHLRHLEFEVLGEQFNDNVFLNMIKSRWRPKSPLSSDSVACLQSVYVDITSRSFTYFLIKPLRYLKLGGLDIVVTDKDGQVDIRFDDD